MFPEREWFGVANEWHTFVVDSDGEVFDLLLHDSFDPKYHYTDEDAEVLPLGRSSKDERKQALKRWADLNEAA